jgi:hypothetical protein
LFGKRKQRGTNVREHSRRYIFGTYRARPVGRVHLSPTAGTYSLVVNPTATCSTVSSAVRDTTKYVGPDLGL